MRPTETLSMSGKTEFPEDAYIPEGAETVSWNRGSFPMANVFTDVVYQSKSGEKQHLLIFTPMRPSERPLPLIVYVQGSAWHRQPLGLAVPKALKAVSCGYAFAIVEYRPSDVAPFPAQIEDAKTAVRYMRKHCCEYNIDPENIGIWGDSSGGHTASFVGITGDKYPVGEYTDETCRVKCVADWYGPSDISKMCLYPSIMDHCAPDSPEGVLIGRRDVLECPEEAQRANPINYISDEDPVPPFLIMHGSADDTVPYNQSVLLYEALKAHGKEAYFYRVEGAGHGTGGFTSDEAMNTVMTFFGKYLK